MNAGQVFNALTADPNAPKHGRFIVTAKSFPIVARRFDAGESGEALMREYTCDAACVFELWINGIMTGTQVKERLMDAGFTNEAALYMLGALQSAHGQDWLDDTLAYLRRKAR